MRLVTSVVLIAALGLSACEAPPSKGTPPGKGTSEGQPSEISYDCGGGKLLKATYPDARTAVVNYDGQSFTLTLAQSASGSRYVGAGREWWIRAFADREEGTLSPSSGGAAAGGPPIATCKKAPTPGTGATPPPPTTDWPTTSPTSAVSCKSGDLSLKRISEDAGAGQRHVVYAFVNNAKFNCSLKGYATAQWLDANGKPLDGVTVIQSEAGGPVSGPPAEVTLQANARAVFFVSYTGIQATDKACVTSATLRLTAPGNTQAIEIADVVAPCTDHITLGPVRADPGDAAL